MQRRTIAEETTGAETYITITTVAVEIWGLDTDATTEHLVAVILVRLTNAMTTENIKIMKSIYGGKSTAVVLLFEVG